MVNLIVVGMQWGDEGKGKIVDLLSPAFDGVVRYQGGHNAGHTVKFADRHFSLQLIPSGILHPGMDCVLGNGMVIAPDAFFTEVERLEKEGVRVDKRLFVSNRAHALLPPVCLGERQPFLTPDVFIVRARTGWVWRAGAWAGREEDYSLVFRRVSPCRWCRGGRSLALRR